MKWIGRMVGACACAVAASAGAGALDECNIRGDRATVARCLADADAEAQAALLKAEGAAAKLAHKWFTRVRFLAGGQRLLGPLQLEGRADPDGAALAVQDDAERALAHPPADGREVRQIDAAVEKDRVHTVGGHQDPGPLLAGFVVLGPQGGNALDQVFQGGDGSRLAAQKPARAGQGQGQASELQEIATMDHGQTPWPGGRWARGRDFRPGRMNGDGPFKDTSQTRYHPLEVMSNVSVRAPSGPLFIDIGGAVGYFRG